MSEKENRFRTKRNTERRTGVDCNGAHNSPLGQKNGGATTFPTSKRQQRCLGERGWISTQACGVRGFRDGVEALKEFDE